MIGLVSLIYVLAKIKQYDKSRRLLILLFLILFFLYIVMYQFNIQINYGTLTIGSDEQRYFDIIYNKSILNDSLFFPTSTSNTIYFWINYIYRTVSINDFFAILSLRITNSILFMTSYIIIIDIIKLILKKTPKVTMFDLLYLALPSGIYMFSRNVRDVYIVVLLLLILKRFIIHMKKGYTIKNVLYIFVLLSLLAMFRSGFVVLIFAIIALFIIFVSPSEYKIKFQLGRFIVPFILSFLVIIYFEEYFRNVLLVSSVYGFSQYEQFQIYQYSNIQLIFTLLEKMVRNIPYLILEPSLINSLRFYSETDLSNIYMPIDYVQLFAYSIINQLIIFPMGIIAIIGSFFKQKKELFVYKFILIVFVILIATIYSSSIGSPDIRTKNFFIIPILVLIWLTVLSNDNNISKEKYILAFIIINILLAYFGLFL